LVTYNYILELSSLSDDGHLKVIGNDFHELQVQNYAQNISIVSFELLVHQEVVKRRNYDSIQLKPNAEPTIFFLLLLLFSKQTGVEEDNIYWNMN
jgi:hypothetical protein